jgi:cell division protein FtsW
MLFVGRARLSHLVGLALIGASSLALMIAKAPYRFDRLTTFLHPELDPLGIGYHINQAFLAIGSGGWFGLGLGHSRQKFEYLPEVHADSIFAVVGEEMGFVFAAGLVILILLIAYRGFQLAKQTRDQFGGLLVAGIMIWFVFQSFLNIGAMAGILPLTGVPLPFVSHGGTALAVALAAVGLVVNVSKHVT